MSADCTIKRKSIGWKFVPFAGRDTYSTTIKDTIYLTPDRYDDYQRDSPKNSTIALVEHEKVHIAQWRRDKHYELNYVTSREKRLAYESEAYGMQAYIRVTEGGRDRDERVAYYASILSSLTYLLFMSFEDVAEAIDAEYEKLVKANYEFENHIS